MMIKRFLFGIVLLMISCSQVYAACGSGSPQAGFVCAAPAGSPGPANYRALANGHIPSGIDAAKIGGGSVSTTEYNRLDGITAFGQSLIDDADAAAARSTLAVVIGTNVQAFDSDLTTWAGLTPSANAQSLVTAANYAAMRALLDLEAGTDFYSISAANAAFQPLDSDLTTWAGVTSSSNGRSLVSAADYAAMRALLDLEAGTDFYSIAAANAAFQPLDSDLTSIAALATTAAGRSVLTMTDPNMDRFMVWDDSAGAGVPIAMADLATEAAPAAGDFIMITRAEGDARKVDWNQLPGVGGGISNVVEDTTPQLGGALDTNGFPIEFGTGNTDTSMIRSGAGDVSIEGNVVYRAGGTDVALADGGTGASLTDPGADRGMFWDDSANATAYLTFLAPLTITGTNIDCDAATTSADGCSELATSAETEAGSDTGRVVTPSGLLAAFSGAKTISIPGGAITSAATSGCTSTKYTATTNLITMQTCGYTSTSADEFGWFHFTAPKSWDEGTITARFYWGATSGSGNVVWSLACLARSDDDPNDTALGTAQTVTDALTATNDTMISSATAAITVGGSPGENDLIICRAARVGSNGSDTFSGTALLEAVKVVYNVNAMTDD